MLYDVFLLNPATQTGGALLPGHVISHVLLAAYGKQTGHA